jgi:hydrocephalus-inducing protein
VKEITATFTPQAAIKYSLTAFCAVSGRADRLPITIEGQGIGPRAVFSYGMLDIGEVYINAVHRYSVVLQNIGEIDCSFTLKADAQQGNGEEEEPVFQFSPSQGTLTAGQGDAAMQKIAIQFSSDKIGDFTEHVEWTLVGTNEPLKIIFKGTDILYHRSNTILTPLSPL